MSGHKHHSSSHEGNPSNNGTVTGSALLFAIILNFIITLAEVIGGLMSNSLALLSDALHNFSDGLALVLAYVALIIARKASNHRKTFGYKRAEILAAFINAIVLIAICLYLFYEAYERFLNPLPIQGNLMLIVAIIGLLGNMIAVIILHKGKHSNLNFKAAYLHLIGDTISSFAVIIGSIFIMTAGIYWIDPLLTVLIGLYIIKETYEIVAETVDILMQGSPKNISLNEICSEIVKFDEISNIHHVHIWKLDDKSIHFECHIELRNDLHLSETEAVRHKVEHFLEDKFGIGHTTIQLEFASHHSRDIVINNQNCSC